MKRRIGRIFLALVLAAGLLPGRLTARAEEAPVGESKAEGTIVEMEAEKPAAESGAEKTAAEAARYTIVISYQDKPLDGARIRVFLGGTSDPLAVSDTGSVTVLMDGRITVGDMLRYQVELPDGYQFPDGESSIDIGNVIDEYDFESDSVSYRYVTNPAKDGKLEASRSSLTLKVGETFDLSGARNLEKTDFQVFHVAPDGARTRVQCKSFTHSWTATEAGVIEIGNDDILTAKKAGQADLVLSSGDAYVVLPITIVDPNAPVNPPTEEPDPSEGEDDYDWGAFRVIVGPEGSPEIGKEAVFRVTITNQTGEAKTVKCLHHWYYREAGNSETYPGIEFGDLVGENGESKENIRFEAHESRSYRLTGVLPDTWNEHSEISIVVEGVEGFGQGEWQQPNSAIDGRLEANLTSLTLRKGETFDLGGAKDLAKEDFQLFYVTPDGTKTRVLAENLSTPMPDSVSTLLDSVQMVKDVPEYRCFAHFKYQNCVFSLPITILNPDAPQEPSSNETTYKTEDGTIMRKIEASGEASAEVRGREELIPSGTRFLVSPVASGSWFEKVMAFAKEQKNLTNGRVFDMRLVDGNDVEIHQLEGYVTVTIAIPEDMKRKENSKLTVYRVEEDGTMVKCYTSVKDGKVSFNTNHFSTYLLAEEEASASGSGTGVKSPQTGDTAGRFLWLFALSAFGLWFLFQVKSKEARESGRDRRNGPHYEI